MLHFLSTAERYLIVCSIKSNLFDAASETTGQRWLVFLYSALLENVVRNTWSQRRSCWDVFFCLLVRFGECLLSVLSARLLQDWNLVAEPHCEEHTGGTFSSTKLHSQMKNWKHNSFFWKHAKIPPDLTFVLNAWDNAESSKYTLVGGKSPNQNSLSRIMISPSGRSDG